MSIHNHDSYIYMRNEFPHLALQVKLTFAKCQKLHPFCPHNTYCLTGVVTLLHNAAFIAHL